MFRLANKNDLPVLKELWNENFLEHDSQESIDFYFENVFDLEHTFILEDNNKIVSSLQLNQHTLMIDNQPEEVSFVVGVATFKEHQRKGYMRLLLNYALEYAKDILNQRLIILQAYNWDVYRSFGFVETYYKNKHNFSVDNLDDYDEAELIANDSEHLLYIYQEYTKKLNGYKIRDAAYYDLQAKMLAIDNVKIASSEQAYVFYEKEKDSLNINECAFESNIALCSLIKTICKQENIQTINILIDNYNYNIETKELFMMTKKIADIKLDVNDKLYISEWI